MKKRNNIVRSIENKMKGYSDIETEIFDELLQPKVIRIVKFSEIMEGEKGEYIDKILEEEKWELQILQNGDCEGYQLFLGEGIQVDNQFEYGFPHLYELDDVLAFAEQFYDYRKSLTEEELQRIKEEMKMQRMMEAFDDDLFEEYEEDFYL
jgi:hypothetical protein